MEHSTHALPVGTVDFRKGDFILSRSQDGQWKVFRVDDIVLVSRLVALNFKHGVEFIEEKDVLDSARPEIYVVVTSFSRAFPASPQAVEAIKTKALGESVSNTYVRVEQFTKENSVVYKAGGGP
ncbi:hypothetical protein ATI61_11963 [Archangium gephyra]|uniref:Uncharacterized protein n=1 Tax=Archangium gephyra TaxID=48 RepID=A0ABX9JMG2_9BACT|nr:hypothetical protein [Archangium gephyra]REG22533.1 hypothetical protein ATI61_11963 [Archangium gephyra]